MTVKLPFSGHRCHATPSVDLLTSDPRNRAQFYLGTLLNLLHTPLPSLYSFTTKHYVTTNIDEIKVVETSKLAI